MGGERRLLLDWGAWWLTAVAAGWAATGDGGVPALALAALAFLAGTRYLLSGLLWLGPAALRRLGAAAGLALAAAGLQGLPAVLPRGAWPLALVSALPVVVGGLAVPEGGAVLVLVASALLFGLDAEAAWAFLLTTAPLGLAAAWAAAPGRRAWRHLVPGAALLAGLLLRARLGVLPELLRDALATGWPGWGAAVAFALGYGALWALLADALRRWVERRDGAPAAAG